MADHRRLLVWQRSSALSLAIHRAAARMPAGVAPGLKAQLLRAVASIPSNIAEGNRRRTAVAYLEFVSTSLGSASEVDTQLELAKGLSLFPAVQVDRWLDEIDQISRMLDGLQRYLEARADAESRARKNGERLEGAEDREPHQRTRRKEGGEGR